MKISLNWLKDYIQVDLNEKQIAEVLTSIGLEVESIDNFQSIRGGLVNYFIGEVLEVQKHPNADKLKLTRVDIGEKGVFNIVCGAPNVAQGQKVVVALPGAEFFLPDQSAIEIKETKIRGEQSQGMICSERELGLSDQHDGILVLNTDTPNGTPAAVFFNIIDDIVFEIGLTPNRADAMSHFGVARDLAAALKMQNIPFKFNKDGSFDYKVTSTLFPNPTRVELKSELAPIFNSIQIKNLANKITPDVIKNRLKAIGEVPKNLIVDTTNYILHDLGQPLHAYDLSKLESSTIVVEEASTTEDMSPIIGDVLKIQPGDILIKNNGKIIGLGGIMGSNETKVSDDTSEIVLEAAYFDSSRIRITSQRLNLKSEASTHFEKGVDPNGVLFALEKAKSIIMQFNTTAQCSETQKESIKQFSPYSVTLTREKLDKYTHIRFSDDTVDTILSSLGIEILSKSTTQWELHVPRFKHDVTRDVDVIEELLRIYGYDNIPMPSHLKSNINKSSKLEETQWISNVSSYLEGKGYAEIMSNSISQSKWYPEKGLVKLLNSMTSELDCMRSATLPEILTILDYNIRYGNKNLNFFEFGKIYLQVGDRKFIEDKKLILVQTGWKQSPSWNHSKGIENGFENLKSSVEQLMSFLNIKAKYSSLESETYQYGVEIKSGKTLLGSLGMVSSKLAKKFNLDDTIFFAELNVDKLIATSIENAKIYQPISKFPIVQRDLSLIIDLDINYQELETIAYNTLGKNLTKVQLFDIYKGKNLTENTKSYAMRFWLQDTEKTMTDKEIEGMMNKLIDAFSKQAKAKIRS